MACTLAKLLVTSLSQVPVQWAKHSVNSDSRWVSIHTSVKPGRQAQCFLSDGEREQAVPCVRQSKSMPSWRDAGWRLRSPAVQKATHGAHVPDLWNIRRLQHFIKTELANDGGQVL